MLGVAHKIEITGHATVITLAEHLMVHKDDCKKLRETRSLQSHEHGMKLSRSKANGVGEKAT